jgi:hypothetical protein
MACERSTVVLAVCLLLAQLPAAAQGLSASDAQALMAETAFDIPAQPLDSALVAFARVSGVDVLNDNEVTAGRQTAGVRGELAPLEALEHLLAGTGLKVLIVHARAVVIVMEDTRGEPLSASAEHGPALALDTLQVRAPGPQVGGDGERYTQYTTAVRAQIESRLRSLQDERAAQFSAVVRLWIAPDGRVVRLAWEHDGGDGAMDRAIEQQLQDTQLARPPSEAMPQPLRFEIRLFGTH